jgi:hypothetical protein
MQIARVPQIGQTTNRYKARLVAGQTAVRTISEDRRKMATKLAKERIFMSGFKAFALAAAAGLLLTASAATSSPAQVGVSIGVAPDCPYGYYDYAPYGCAPYGYYGPEWFSGGVFIGAGPWYHGGEHFYGHVDNHFDPQHGYKGPHPEVHAKVETGREERAPHEFHGNEMRDGRGHTGGGEHEKH